MTPARTLAKQWRANPSDRLRIERMIAVSGRQSEFSRNRKGELVAKVTQADRERVAGASASLKAFKSSSAGFREMPEMTVAEKVKAFTPVPFERPAVFDGERVSPAVAQELRDLGRAA
jgi:hypothetical protein